MPPTNRTLENDIALLNEHKQEQISDREVEKLQNNLSELSAKIAAAFLAEKNKNSKTRTSPSSTFGNILTQLTKFVTLSPKSPQAEKQLAQNRKILDILQTKYYSLLRDDNAPISAHHQRVMSEVAKKISTWVESISREADRKLVENRTLRAIVEEAAAEVDAQTAIIDKPNKPKTRASIVRTQSEIVPLGKSGIHDDPSLPSSPASAGTTISNVNDVYDWANWMVDAMATAEEWRSWIQKTVEETNTMNRDIKPTSQADWTVWKGNVADEAVKLIKRKKEIQDTAPTWAKECCETMAARDFALNTVTTHACSVPRTPHMQAKSVGDEAKPKKTIDTSAKSWARPTFASQSATVNRLSGPNLVPPSQRPSSRQNLVPSGNSALPVTTKQPLPKGVSLSTTRTPSRQNLPAPRRDSAAITVRQSVRAPKRDVSPMIPGALQRPNAPAPKRDVSPIEPGASPKQNVPGPTPRNPSPNAARHSVATTTRSPSPATTKLQPKLNAAKSMTSPTNPPLSRPKKPEAANAAPITKLTVRPKDNERKSIYATEYSKKKPSVVKNTKPVAAPKVSSISNPTGSFCFEPPPKVRRPRSPYSVPQPKCPMHLKDGKGMGQGFGAKSGGQSPKRHSPQREVEEKVTGKGNPMGKEMSEKGAMVPVRFVKPNASIRTKQEVVAKNAGQAPTKRTHK